MSSRASRSPNDSTGALRQSGYAARLAARNRASRAQAWQSAGGLASKATALARRLNRAPIVVDGLRGAGRWLAKRWRAAGSAERAPRARRDRGRCAASAASGRRIRRPGGAARRRPSAAESTPSTPRRRARPCAAPPRRANGNRRRRRTAPCGRCGRHLHRGDRELDVHVAFDLAPSRRSRRTPWSVWSRPRSRCSRANRQAAESRNIPDRRPERYSRRRGSAALCLKFFQQSLVVDIEAQRLGAGVEIGAVDE